MDPTQHMRLIEAEYFKLQEIVEAFDAKALQFKGWSVTVTLAAAAAALASDKLHADQRQLVLALAAFGSFIFWLTETMWKLFQQAFMVRLRAIEQAFASSTAESLIALQISTAWKDEFKQNKFAKFIKYACKPNTWLPHLAVTAFCIAMMIYLVFNPIGALPN